MFSQRQSNCTGRSLLERLVAADINEGQSNEHPHPGLTVTMGKILGGKVLRSYVYK